jgi:hypothetical protein
MACLSEAALELAGAGHPVLPLHTPTARGCSCGRHCGRVGKHPRSTYGLKSATTDLRRVEAWWHGQPGANIGMRCDALLVVDLDYGGKASLAMLEWELGELPETRRQSSGRGEHCFYSTPPGVLLGNSTAPLGNPRGLDLRAGDRGYIVVAPSLHASGHTYRWLDPEAPIAPLPETWLERLLELPSLPTRESELVAAEGTTCYGLAALEAELRKVRAAAQGRRNNQLNTSVFKLAQLVAGGQLDLGQLEAEATAAGLDVGLGAQETEDTIASAVTAGYRQPRGPR